MVDEPVVCAVGAVVTVVAAAVLFVSALCEAPARVRWRFWRRLRVAPGVSVVVAGSGGVVSRVRAAL